MRSWILAAACLGLSGCAVHVRPEIGEWAWTGFVPHRPGTRSLEQTFMRQHNHAALFVNPGHTFRLQLQRPYFSGVWTPAGDHIECRITKIEGTLINVWENRRQMSARNRGLLEEPFPAAIRDGQLLAKIPNMDYVFGTGRKFVQRARSAKKPSTSD